MDSLYGVSDNVASSPGLLSEGQPFREATGSSEGKGSWGVRFATTLSGDVMKTAMWFEVSVVLVLEEFSMIAWVANPQLKSQTGPELRVIGMYCCAATSQ